MFSNGAAYCCIKSHQNPKINDRAKFGLTVTEYDHFPKKNIKLGWLGDGKMYLGKNKLYNLAVFHKLTAPRFVKASPFATQVAPSIRAGQI